MAATSAGGGEVILPLSLCPDLLRTMSKVKAVLFCVDIRQRTKGQFWLIFDLLLPLRALSLLLNPLPRIYSANTGMFLCTYRHTHTKKES